eukprot:XP_014043978.1 PREDICTED: uncharacterized protein LOC106597293 [Salmo salar]
MKSLKKILKNLAPGREYCVSVRIMDSEERSDKNSSYSQPHCAFTAAKYIADTEISVVLCLLVLFGLCSTTLLFRTGFICLRQHLPEVLVSYRLIQIYSSPGFQSIKSILLIAFNISSCHKVLHRYQRKTPERKQCRSTETRKNTLEGRTWLEYSIRRGLGLASRVAQRSKALHHSARGITTDPGSIPGCDAAGRDRKTHEAAHNWLSVVQVRGGFGSASSRLGEGLEGRVSLSHRALVTPY